MSETSDAPITGAHESAHQTPESFPRWWSSPRTITLLALVIALAAVAVAIAAWFRAGQGPSYKADQISQAKTNVCATYKAVREAIVESTHMTSPEPDNPVGELAVAANARTALLGGGAYLRDRLDGEPATPADLAKALTSMSTMLQQLGVNYLAGTDNTVQDPLRKNLDDQITKLNGLCK